MKSRQLRLSPELAFDSISCLKPNTRNRRNQAFLTIDFSSIYTSAAIAPRKEEGRESQNTSTNTTKVHQRTTLFNQFKPAAKITLETHRCCNCHLSFVRSIRFCKIYPNKRKIVKIDKSVKKSRKKEP
jgi:hypothetical protein